MVDAKGGVYESHEHKTAVRRTSGQEPGANPGARRDALVSPPCTAAAASRPPPSVASCDERT